MVIEARRASHRSVRFSFRLAFHGGLALVVLLLSFCYRKQNLYEVSLSINPKGNECQAVYANLSNETFYLASLHKEPPRADGVVASGVARVGVEGNECVCEEELVAAERDEAPLKTYVSGFDGLHLVSQECNTRLDRLEEFIVKPRALVFGDRCHNGVLVVYSSTTPNLGKMESCLFSFPLFILTALR